MIVLRDFALFILPGLVAAGGWLFALDLRKQADRAGQRTVTSCARTDVRKCS
jgi:hypothetical protein